LEGGKRKRTFHVHPAVIDFIYDGQIMVRNRQEDAHEILTKLLTGVDESSAYWGDRTVADALKATFSQITHKVVQRRICGCGYESKKEETQQDWKVPMKTLAEGEAPPKLEALLRKSLGTEEMDSCSFCQGLLKVAEEEELLLRS
ncbi:unnamed protein product, partial [Scytosiphon promiscuus]